MNSFVPVSTSGDAASDYRQDALWVRIQQFALDDAESALPFSRRLARENGWSRHYAVRVISEYKKFCYLALTTGCQVTPSDAVDQAWHLHLIYTQSYWNEFCGRVLRRPLHHNPTRGGAEQRDKYRDLYSGTLDLYQRVFNVSPPEDIWPTVDERFANSGAFRRIDTASSWILPRPKLRLWVRRRSPLRC
jgi:hypothetical protein